MNENKVCKMLSFTTKDGEHVNCEVCDSSKDYWKIWRLRYALKIEMCYY